MVIDSSAVIAILLEEPEQDIFKGILASETSLVMSAVTFHEASIVMAGKKRTPAAAALVDDFIDQLQIDVATSSIEDALAAREAYFRFGRGYHSAALNLADCFSYALAKSRNEPLLYKGDDFSKTDVISAWLP
jgi:ribonuclease VapC